MDPNATLARLRGMAKAALTDADAKTWPEKATIVAFTTEFAELFQALDAWIVGGGFLPAKWSAKLTRRSE